MADAKVGSWKRLRPHESRSLATLITCAGLLAALGHFAPNAFAPFRETARELGQVWWLFLVAFFAWFFVESYLIGWFGKVDERGLPEQYVDPVDARFELIEAAINRLHRRVQELDPELAEEIRLEHEFMTDSGGIFAGMSHHDYVRDREAKGLRTLYTDSIWRDPEPRERDEG